MRKFNVVFWHKKKNVVYRDLEGLKAIKLMEDLTKKGFQVYASTYSFGIHDVLTLSEMKESVL